MDTEQEFPSLIMSTLDGRVNLYYSEGKSDEEIAVMEGISVGEVAEILKHSRLPVRITSFKSQVWRDGRWVDGQE